MGSGHILVCAFDVLYEIYLSAGYSERDIPTLILEKNLYGLDIDDRAGQLASFALLMKARSKNRRIFRNKPKLNLCSIQESNDISKEAVEYLVSPGKTELEKHVHKEDAKYLIEVFHDAKEYGSILEVKEIDFDALENRIEEIRNGELGNMFERRHREVILEKIPPLIQQGRVMSQKYDVVCTNPPYMGHKGMDSKLIGFLKRHYNDSKTDLFSVFMDLLLLKEKGFLAMINQHSWMFLFSYKKLRIKKLSSRTIYNMMHLGSRAFEEIGGEVVQSTTFIERNYKIDRYNASYIRLTDYSDAQLKKERAKQIIEGIISKDKYITMSDDFIEIPGSPIAYWISKGAANLFKRFVNLSTFAEPRSGLSTTDNNRFLRYWYEIEFLKIGFDFSSTEETKNSGKIWFPYNKGGTARKWYGNQEYIVDWKNDGERIRENAKGATGGRIVNPEYYFREGITWSTLSTDDFAVRYSPKGFIFDSKGALCYVKDRRHIFYLIGLLNSSVVNTLLKVLAPTLDYNPGSVAKVPLILSSNEKIDILVIQNIELLCIDWDSFETSWDFLKHPLLTYKHNAASIQQAFNNWSTFTEQQFNQLKANEEELNRIFIEIYDLQDELIPEVEDKDITIRKADRERDIKSFISYAVGCMFGRYSLDEDGLIYAGGDFDDKFRVINDRWKVKTKKGWKESSIDIAKYNVIPIADGDYFEDDILQRFVEFVKVSFGEKTLEENLKYIADTLGTRASETSRQAIRRYFLKDFYKDHVRIYKKRPIYWLFDSGRQDGFKALIYIHRYDAFTVARVRTNYLHSLQKKYEAEISHLDILIESDMSSREKAAAKKNKEIILKRIQECRVYDEAIAHVANQRIEIDLDDGVKVNYAKFQGVEVPQGEGKKPLKANLLAKI